MDPRPTPTADDAATTRTARKRLALGSAVILATALIGIPVVNAAAATGDTVKTLSNIVPGLAALDDLGTVAADKQMTIGISIPGKTAAEAAAYRAITTPGSTSYGFRYTPASFAAAFGVSAEVSRSVLTWATGNGLKSVYDAADGSYVELTGTAAQVEQTFKVSVHDYQVKGKTYYASTAGATVPLAVGTVLGLSNFDAAHLDASQGTCAATQCTGVAAPDALWGAYGEPDTYTEGAALKSSDDYGQGQQVAIFGEGDLTQVVTDLRNFEDDTDVNGDTADLKPKLPHIPVAETLVNDPQNAMTDTAGLGEWDLDSQSSTGMSPDLSQLQFYFGSDLSDASIAATYSAWVNDSNGSMIGNSSFGGCEPLSAALGEESTDDALLQQAVMMGRTMFVSTGDTGSGGCVVGVDVNGVANGGAPAIEYPAASPFVVAVGGTTLYTAGSVAGVQNQPVTRGIEDSWDESGGGEATSEAQPTDQGSLGGLTPPFTPCVLNDAGNPSTAGSPCRSVPDVAAMSGDIITNGYGIETGSKPGMPGSGESETGGTSLSSPLWAGMWARVRAAHTATGCAAPNAAAIAPLTTTADSTKADLGFAQLDLYDIAESNSVNDDAAFFDIGGTTNSQPGTTTVAGNGTYTALPRSAADPTGFDFTSGLGTPDLGTIVKILDCTVAPTEPTAIPDSTAVTFPPVAASNCPPNGTLTDPTGDETPSDGALDIVSVKDVSDAGQVTFNVTLASLPETDPAFDDLYDADFSYGGAAYVVEADDANPSGPPTFTLYAAGTNGNTKLSSITGSFTNATATVSMVMTYAQFNSAAKPKLDLGPGSTLTALSDDTETTAYEEVNFSDVAAFGSCSYNLTGNNVAGPPVPPKVTTSPPAAPAAPVTTGFHPLSYAGLSSATVKQGRAQTVTLLGSHGIPKTNVTDVLLQVTADKATATSPVTVGGEPALQTAKGTTARNIVVVTPDSHGRAQLAVAKGSARLALAIVGYDSRGVGDGFNPTFGGRVSATLTPITTAKHALAVKIGGKGGVPAANLDAALLDARVSAVALPRGVTAATLYATVAGSSRKVAIATVSPAATTTALLIARPDRSGKVTFSLSAGSAKIVVNGYGAWATPSYTSRILTFDHAVTPKQAFSATLGTKSKTFTVSGLPTGVSSVVFQVSIAAGKNSGELQAATAGARFGDGSVSYLANLGAVQLISIAPDSHGRVSLRLTKGSRGVKLSLVGYSALT